MDSVTSERPTGPPPPDPTGPPTPAPATALPALASTADNGLKIAIVGGRGVGKSTMVRSVSEIRPLITEETTDRAGEGIDELAGLEGLHRDPSTTIAFDFGRVSLDARSVLYLFGAPGQEHFWSLWDRLFPGTLGAVVLVDTRRLTDSWYAIDRLAHYNTPFIVACNDFGGPLHTEEQIRDALGLSPDVPMVECDARDRSSSKYVLITLVEHLRALSLKHATAPAAAQTTPDPTQTTPDPTATPPDPTTRSETRTTSGGHPPHG
ncbi:MULTISPECIES: GTP-binding protein [unclassified Streptomyces]|uniref:GTP-binding protein n=1 Tax=unclassified Streptomyces TaxID=2593676 RepID=UPI003806D989